MKKQTVFPLLIAATLVLSGCSLFGGSKSADGAAAPSSQDSAPAPVTFGGSDAGSGLPQSITPTGGAGAGSGAGAGLAPVDTVIYFEYDSTVINSAGYATIEYFGRLLADNPTRGIRLEGHADERGTRDYNIGLGERRANVVYQALLNAGAARNQMIVTSYGEERPADLGHDEAAWARNRRVEIIQ